MIEQLSKRNVSFASGTSRMSTSPGGISVRLIHSANTEAATPTGASAIFQSATVSQIQKKNANRAANTLSENGARWDIAQLNRDCGKPKRSPTKAI